MVVCFGEVVLIYLWSMYDLFFGWRFVSGVGKWWWWWEVLDGFFLFVLFVLVIDW